MILLLLAMCAPLPFPTKYVPRDHFTGGRYTVTIGSSTPETWSFSIDGTDRATKRDDADQVKGAVYTPDGSSSWSFTHYGHTGVCRMRVIKSFSSYVMYDDYLMTRTVDGWSGTTDGSRVITLRRLK